MEDYKVKIVEYLLGNYQLTEAQHTQINKISDAIDYAWNQWDDAIVETFYQGKKPEQPTDKFIIQWIENEDFEADGFNVDYLNEIF